MALSGRGEGHNGEVPSPRLVFAAAILGLSGVLLGAFGAHALGLAGKPLDTWHTAGQYHLGHALAALLAALLGATRAGWLFVAGTLVFSGSLYLLVVTGAKWLGAVTPVGGALFLVGWGMLAAAAIKPSAPRL